MEVPICFGVKAKETLSQNLHENANIKLKGYYYDRDIWIAFDNSSGDCWVEEFLKESQAIAWLNNYFEASMIDEIKTEKIFYGLYYIKFQGKIKFFKKTS